MTDSRSEPWTQAELQQMQQSLNKLLGPEFVSRRPAPGGGKVPYLEGWKAINLANSVFGFNGWSSEVKNVAVDYFDDHGGSGKYDLGLSVTVRVSLKDGTFHEDIGYGHIENARSRYMAFEKCKKEATTDALKRSLRCFGNVLGNCLYDRRYIQQVAKIKPSEPPLSEESLHRFGDATRQFNRPEPPAAPQGMPRRIPKEEPAQPPEELDLTFRSDDIYDFNEFDEDIEAMESFVGREATAEPLGSGAKDPISNPINPSARNNDIGSTNITPVKFFSARAADLIQKNSPVNDKSLFNPSFQSPSMRRTIDQTRSAPVKRSAVEALLSESRKSEKQESVGGAGGAANGVSATSATATDTLGDKKSSTERDGSLPLTEEGNRAEAEPPRPNLASQVAHRQVGRPPLGSNVARRVLRSEKPAAPLREISPAAANSGKEQKEREREIKDLKDQKDQNTTIKHQTTELTTEEPETKRAKV